jgi:hypothetical protein
MPEQLRQRSIFPLRRPSDVLPATAMVGASSSAVEQPVYTGSVGSSILSSPTNHPGYSVSGDPHVAAGRLDTDWT